MFTWSWAWGVYSFTFALVAFSFMVCSGLVRKPHFWLRLLAVLAVLVAFTLLWRYLSYAPLKTYLEYPSAYGLLTFVIQLGIVVWGLLFCHRCSVFSALFCATVGYALQHISERSYEIIALLWVPDIPLWEWFLLLSSSTVVLYFVFYFIAIRKVDYTDFDHLVDKKAQIIVSLLIIVMAVFVNSLLVGYARQAGDVSTQISFCNHLFSIALAFLDILYEFSSLHTKSAMNEAARLEHLLEEERHQYDQEKANMELLNVKYHDIKHILNAADENANPAVVAAMKKSLGEYESIVKTGNPAIDTILSQKSEYCKNQGIRFSCLLNGADLSFIDDYELYTLFTNAIDNAIDASLVCDPDQRVISISEQAKDNFAIIKIVNFFKGDLDFKNGLPKTKKDSDYHGFGLKSMSMIAEKYDGRVSTMTQGSLFILQIFLPLHSK